MWQINVQVCVWKRLTPDSTEHIIKAECYIFLINFLNSTVSSMEGGLIAKKADVESDLWLEGKKIGRLLSSFMVEHPPFLRQKVVGVMTENGLKKSAPMIIGNSNNPKVKELIRLLILLKDLHYKIESSARDKKSTLIINMKEKLEVLHKILHETDKVSSKAFIYKTLEDMAKAQELLIELCDMLVTSQENLDPMNEDITYICIMSILKRGEFELSAIGFDHNLSKKQTDIKRKVGVEYQRLLYELLDEIFDDLEQKALTGYRRHFIEYFLAYAYFRIPKFRNELLSALNRQDTVKKPIEKEYKEIESVLLDWEKDFYSHLACHEKYGFNVDLLNNALKKNWKEKFQRKGTIFFYFIIQWCQYVIKTLVVKDFFWENIHGYEILVNSFVEQLGIRDVSNYPDVLIEASKALLANPNVLDVMVKTLISKTK